MFTRPFLRLGQVCTALSFAASFLIGGLSAAHAQSAGVTQITGTVLDAQRHPVSDATVRLSGSASKTTSTGGDGSFSFVDVPAGNYRLDISKGGFTTSTQDEIVTTAGATTNVSFTLQAASLTSLTEIGHVTVNTRNAANAINTTPASIVDVPATTFADQGQISVNQVLNEEPGVTIGVVGGGEQLGNSGANPLSTGIPSVRGGLPYETESLVDGHMIALGSCGLFSPNFLSPYMLQDVEIVKGPGATSPSINYAINGTVNYRTLEPTLKPQESVDLMEDQYGGNAANLRATGTLPGGRLSYAFDYATQGTQGFQRDFSPPGWLISLNPTYLNGVPIEGFPGGWNLAGPTPSGLADIYSPLTPSDTGMMCCQRFPKYFNQQNQLGKLRYAFTPSTVLTVAWLGEQSIGSYNGEYYDSPYGYFTFDPPAGYTGSIAPGPEPGFYNGLRLGWNIMQDSNLFETEFHMPLGKTATLLLRQYSSSIDCFLGGPGDSGATAAPPTSLTVALYGGFYYCPDPSCSSTTEQTFNGQVGTITETQAYSENRTFNHLNGFTAEIDKQAGPSLLSLSYDLEKTSTWSFGIGCGQTTDTVGLPQGSSQTFESAMGRAQFELGERVNGTISDNFGSYTDVYSQDGGLTFQSATHTYQAPRLSLTWRPNANQSLRGSIGTSIAPPYIGLLNNSEYVGPSGGSAFDWCTSGNSGDVLPETAFGFDLGFDTRLHSPYTILSVDMYQTLLRNQFLNETSEQGTYTCTATSTPGCDYQDYNNITRPLFVNKTANLGHSEYEGIELALHRTPPTGWGYRIQGSLMRAFVYDLPAGFYDTESCTSCTNLAILPNENFMTGGIGFNGMATSSMPYSMGYGEINYRGRNGASFLAGVTYYGPNNAYDEPAFEVVTVSFTQPISRRASLQLSIYNLTNAYSGQYAVDYGSPINIPLENGYEGGSYANVLGPSIVRLTLHIDM